MNGGLLRPRDIIVDDALDRIYKAWVAHRVDEDLDLADRWLLERMEFIDARLMEGGERSRYTNVLEETYQEFNKVDKSITRRTIESDIARTKRFFLSTRPRTDKDYAKGMAIKHAERMLDILEEKGKYKEWVALTKHLDNELHGFNKEELDLPDYQAVQPPPMMMIMNPGDVGIPLIDDLDEELRILKAPKKENRNTDNIEDAEALDGDE